VAGGWRRSHTEELHNLYSSSHFIRVIKSRRTRRAGLVLRTREMRNAYKILVGKPERTSTVGRRRSRWEDNINMDVRERG
jgi:hypothetical protein